MWRVWNSLLPKGKQSWEVGPYKSAFDARAYVAIEHKLEPAILRCEPV